MTPEGFRLVWAAMTPEQRDRFGALVCEMVDAINRFDAGLTAYAASGVVDAEVHANQT